MKLSDTRSLVLATSFCALAVLAAGAHAQQPSAGMAATAAPRVDTRRERHPQVRRDASGNLVFRNESLAAVLLKNGEGFGPMLFYPSTRAGERLAAPVATVPALAQVTWREGDQTRTGTFRPTQSKLTRGERVELLGTVSDGSTTWQAEAELWIGHEAWISWVVKIRPSTAASLVRFTPMALRTGQEGPRELLFPGLLYAGGFGLDTTNPPAPPRTWMPDPYQITVPLMARTQNETTVSVLWNGRQEWGGAGLPGALLEESAPRGEAETTRMELFVPAAAGSGEGAAEPVAVAAGAEIRLTGKIAVLPEEDRPTNAVRQWVEAFGSPTIEGYPRSFDATREVSRQAFTRTLWDANASGWVPAVGIPNPQPQQDSFNVLALLMDAGLSGKKAVRDELRAQARKVLEKLQAQGPLDPDLAYRTGGVLTSLEAERERVMELVDLQLAAGNWVPDPAARPQAGTEGNPLGSVPPTEVGLVTENARRILRFATWTGDSTAAGAGLRALRYIQAQHRLPRGARPAEFSIDVPDLLSATHAAECFLLGYQVSGERRFIEEARYWADAGMPFIYFWGDKEHPTLQGASIPAFGVSRSGRNWAGTAEQWVGLEYARVLRALSRERPEALYDYLSEAILASGMRQQYVSGEWAGLIPSYWNVRENEGTGPKVSPESLLRAMYEIQDIPVEVSHNRVRVGPDRMFSASGSGIPETVASAMRLRLKLKWLDEQDTFTTIMGVPVRPLRVEYNSNRLIGLAPKKRDLIPEVSEESQLGWYYDDEAGILILRLRHHGNTDDVEIRWPDPKDRSPIDRVDPKIRPQKY